MTLQMLLEEHKESLKSARKMKESAPEEDKKIIQSMITDLEYRVKWMETGRRPGDRKSILRNIVISDPAATKAFEKVENEN